jgi:hypothetical protein
LGEQDALYAVKPACRSDVESVFQKFRRLGQFST